MSDHGEEKPMIIIPEEARSLYRNQVLSNYPNILLDNTLPKGFRTTERFLENETQNCYTIFLQNYVQSLVPARRLTNLLKPIALRCKKNSLNKLVKKTLIEGFRIIKGSRGNKILNRYARFIQGHNERRSFMHKDCAYKKVIGQYQEFY